MIKYVGIKMNWTKTVLFTNKKIGRILTKPMFKKISTKYFSQNIKNMQKHS